MMRQHRKPESTQPADCKRRHGEQDERQRERLKQGTGQGIDQTWSPDRTGAADGQDEKDGT